jgi:hypothetical protein
MLILRNKARAVRQGKLGSLTRGRDFPGLQVATWLFAACLVLAGATAGSGQEKASSEYQMKAAFLFHFAQFVQWPPETFKDAGSPLTYCTLGEDPFQGALDQSLTGKVIESHPLRVRHLKDAQQIPVCQIVFIGTAEKKGMPGVLAAAKGLPVLTVGDTEHFAQDGGMIGFCLEQKRVRFEINLQAAEQANLTISSKLLALAKTVVGDPRGN